MPPAAAQQQQFGGVLRSEAQELLRYKSSWGNLATRLVLMGVGVFMVLYGAFAPRVTAPYRIALWATACFSVLTGAAFLCWDAYLRRKLKQDLAEIRSDAD